MSGARVEKGIIDRVRGLFVSHGITQREFADALGVSPSWVSAFFSGRRPANDIHLLLKIARYFGVTVGYLLNETDRGRDAGASAVIGVWETLDERGRRALLNLALTLRDPDDDRGTARSAERPDGRGVGGGTTTGPAKRPRAQADK